ncbi:hypothetical protein, partial [Xanthomonas hortorum]|uniref:hypothetical protein n=2 Tax=Xanthomonas hortorum TaxID=56454 RepID=UPI002044932F
RRWAGKDQSKWSVCMGFNKATDQLFGAVSRERRGHRALDRPDVDLPVYRHRYSIQEVLLAALQHQHRCCSHTPDDKFPYP